MEITEKFGVLFLLDAVTYNGNQFKELLIDYPDVVYDNNEDADNWLSSRMGKYIIDHDLILIKDWTVKKIGYDLNIEEEKPQPPKPPKDRKIKEGGKVRKPKKIKEEPKTIIPTKPPIDYVNMAFDGRPSYENVYGNNNRIKIPNRKEITTQLKKVIGKRKILIIENSNGLGDGIGAFYKWTLEEKIDSFCVFNANDLPIEFLMSKVIEYDILAFQSQFVYENSRLLKELIVNTLTTPKTIIGVNLRGEMKYNPSDKHILYDLEVYENSDHYDWTIEKL